MRHRGGTGVIRVFHCDTEPHTGRPMPRPDIDLVTKVFAGLGMAPRIERVSCGCAVCQLAEVADKARPEEPESPGNQ